MDGTIKRLITDKKFGFILGEDGAEYFMHSSAAKNKKFETLQEGDKVSFDAGQGAKGPRAENVYVK